MTSTQPTQRLARIGVDVGGTFTDLVLYDPSRQLALTGKLLTTPEDPSIAIINGIKRILSEAGLQPSDLHSVVHGTTLVTNTIIERTGAVVGLITTSGFRDTIEIGRETRYDLYDLFLEMPPVIVPRARRLEVAERVTSEGDVLVDLDEDAVARAARRLVEDSKAEALAISFLHSYRSDRHEQRAAKIVRALYPSLPLSLSSQVAPEIREFERTTTTCANAYVQPLMHRYLDKLEAELVELGFAGRLHIMLSSGGITTVREAKAFPIRLIESGPAAGAMAASFISRIAGLDRVISFDMGGTTAKICLIEDGQPDHKFDFEAGRVRRFQKGSGLPLKVSVVDMIEIGAGGGSLARVDPSSGLLKVGPRSAGSVPGPVCYGRGGDQPTVTDADLVLGRLDPAYFLGGELELDVDLVRSAFDGKISTAINLDVDEAALGVQRIVDETMAAATRMHLAEKGKDPRKYTLIAFGGAGPVHAFNLARLLKVEKMVVPLGAGVASALGFLVAPPATDMVRTMVSRLDAVDWTAINALYADMKAEGVSLLCEAGAIEEQITFKATAEMRHRGQGFEIPVALPSLVLSDEHLDAIRETFFMSYRAQFGRILEDSPIEVLNWRLACSAAGTDISIGQGHAVADATLEGARRGTRKVKFEGHGWLDCAVYNRYMLPAGCKFSGPALVEERESTCVIGPDSVVSVDSSRNLIINLWFVN
ncbi:methylhydantoinase [Mesorhizobium sp. Root102]|uniref:hydantoinase/oxoprolinase family protein n=1 Tax=Mesorhizobium sp. Root102 TaxID=1736422 RepID=UPI0006F84C3C|nr:hydantoinase/oxoprolinase family protein [Mesorhizobium sp. Root102]KQU80083.1 methylhydantoinase [Mesorhizobium sp. Root102]